MTSIIHRTDIFPYSSPRNDARDDRLLRSSIVIWQKIRIFAQENKIGVKKNYIWMLFLVLVCVCRAEDITIRYKGTTAKITQKVKDSVNVTLEGAKVNIESFYTDRKLTLKLTGNSDDGQLNLKTAGKAKVTLDGLTLTSQEGAPICLRNKKKDLIATSRRLPLRAEPFSQLGVSWAICLLYLPMRLPSNQQSC